MGKLTITQVSGAKNIQCVCVYRAGYIHDSHHTPAGLNREAICLQVTTWTHTHYSPNTSFLSLNCTTAF